MVWASVYFTRPTLSGAAVLPLARMSSISVVNTGSGKRPAAPMRACAASASRAAAATPGLSRRPISSSASTSAPSGAAVSRSASV